uniref:F-box domain-containing protein n=1 Tax=Tetranychus urticae TaxID=32264 RepID=A0A158P4D3_TETUR
MSINELPDDCLLIIFGLINELDDLLNCYKVCSKWSQLIAKRTRTVKYFIGHRVKNGGCESVQFPRNVFGYVYYKTKIADFSGFREKVKYEDMVTFVKEIKSLKGLIHKYDTRGELISQYCDQLEMLSTNHIDPCMEKNGVNIKQLRLGNVTLDEFKKDAHFFPNLERLCISTDKGYYDGPILRRLKILELYFFTPHGIYDDPYVDEDLYYGFQFMDSCPNLQSAHLFFRNNRIYVAESVKNKSLQDLVLTYDGFDYYASVAWKDLKRVLMKYPNLKHLALVGNMNLDDEYVEELVRILPNLVLLIVRAEYWPDVTQKAVDYVRDYCNLHGRSIKFYFDDNHHEIQSDWPQLSTDFEKISQGFDFLKNCFLKYSMVLPNFLISNEN